MFASPARSVGVVDGGFVGGAVAGGGVVGGVHGGGCSPVVQPVPQPGLAVPYGGGVRGGVVAGGRGMVAGGAGASGGGGGRVGVGCGGCGVACAGDVEEAAVLSYVGTGGNWQAETTYKYVGGGSGNFEVVMVPTKWYSNLWFLLLAIPLLGLLLWKSSGTTTTTPQDLGPPGVCTIFGDPHIHTFDHAHSDYFTPGEYYIVKTARVSIQGKYLATPMTHGLAVTKEVAIGGAFLNGHTLIIGSLTASFDGKAILTTFPDSESFLGLVRIDYNAQGEVLQKGRTGKQLHVVHVYLPNGIQMQINRWNEPGEGDYINVKITMPREMGMDGECGNFNGVEADDERTAIRARLGKQGVPVGELLFPGPKTPILPSKRPVLADCKQSVLDHAMALCKKKEGTTFPTQACLLDVCYGGDMFAREDNM